MLRVGFESLIPAPERQKTVYTLYSAAVVIGLINPVTHNAKDAFVVFPPLRVTGLIIIRTSMLRCGVSTDMILTRSVVCKI